MKKTEKKKFNEVKFGERIGEIVADIYTLLEEIPSEEIEIRFKAAKFIITKTAFIGGDSYYEALGLIEEAKSEFREISLSDIDDYEEDLQNLIQNYKGPMAEA